MSERVGWTNGCFDILHPGHLHFLAWCKSECDRLIVGLNRDESVRQLKGAGRPINDYSFRESLLRGTRFVDEIVMVWSDGDLGTKIHNLKPAVIFKGEDYLTKHVVGWSSAPIRYVPLLKGYSTTNEIAKRDRLA